MADDGYLGMLCVETAVTQGKTLEPGEVHVLEQTIS
jgi:glucose-6-phosphate 1-epimerase